jgi:hypothetical protein
MTAGMVRVTNLTTPGSECQPYHCSTTAPLPASKVLYTLSQSPSFQKEKRILSLAKKPNCKPFPVDPVPCEQGWHFSPRHFCK